MTHLALIVSAVLLFLFDDMLGPAGGSTSAAAPRLNAAALAALVLLPKLAVAAWVTWRGRVAAARLGGADTARSIRWSNRTTLTLPLVAVALFAGDLALGLLPRVRGVVGNPVLLDELMVWTPTLLLLLAGHAARYPFERRVRESELIRRADRGLPIHPVPGRAAWIAARARQDLGLLLLPLILLMGWGEAVVQLTDAGTFGSRWGPTLGLCLGPAGALGVLIVAPLLLRHALDTVPLPPGPLRDHLLAQSADHGVRVRELLLWRTHGTAINAAVTGLVPRVRYILLTDALVEELSPPQLHAVMEHELNHARHRHLPTLLLVAAALLTSVAAGTEAAAQTLAPVLPGGRSVWLDGVLAVVGLGLWAAAFGWASRRIERQADTPRAAINGFDPHHPVLRGAPPTPERANGSHTPEAGVPETRAHEEDPSPSTRTYTAGHILPMLTALGQVANRAHLNPKRFSWRHGSIDWRQRYLRGLIGTPIESAAIHRVVRWIRVAAVVLLIVGGLGLWWMDI